MADTAQMADITVPMIEAHVETGLVELLAGYDPNYIPGGDKKDNLSDRFTIYPARPLPEFNHAYADAFEAVDHYNTSRSVYAMVCDNNLPYNLRATTEMIGFTPLHLVHVLGAGTVPCSHLSESRFVIFIERPQGIRLSEMIKNKARLHEHKVIDIVLQPACRALNSLLEKKLSHGNIHTGAFYIGETSTLGENLSMPANTQSHYLYKPLERLTCDPLGYGDATEQTDVYALAVLAFELMYGLDHIKAIPRDEYVRAALQMGTYHIFSAGREFSDAFQDLFRGVLNDNVAERWGMDEYNQWINGKRFNMIAPKSPKEAARPLLFMTESFFSRRLLANAFHRHWRETQKDIRNLKVDRWCDTSLHRPELGEAIDRVLRTVNERNALEWQLNEMLTRIIILLDPVGPVRTMGLTIRPDGIGISLAEQATMKGGDVSGLMTLIENNISNFWIEQDYANKTPEMAVIIWKLQRARQYAKMKALGFGNERVLYELNTSLCCQSPLLKPYHIVNVVDALKTLDALASSLAPDTPLTDRHLAAFIASKIDMAKEIKLGDLSSIPALASNEELMMLRLIAKAQQKQAKLVLVGLSTWAAMRIEKLIDEIHNRRIRRRLKLQLRKLAMTGNVSDVLAAIVNREIVNRDLSGFSQSLALHALGHERIERLNSTELLTFRARNLGGKMATNLCYTALAITTYIKVTELWGW